jgi:hypothetical protein
VKVRVKHHHVVDGRFFQAGIYRLSEVPEGIPYEAEEEGEGTIVPCAPPEEPAPPKKKSIIKKTW